MLKSLGIVSTSMTERIMHDRVMDVRSWFPATDYYTEHADRLTYSFSHLPKALPPSFKCLCIGSWGAEVPILIAEFGASEVVCVRAPDKNIPTIERRAVRAPGREDAFPVTLFALDVESDTLPVELRDRFDLVLAWEILEHLRDDPPRMIWQAIKCLRNGGFISLTTPNALWHYHTTAQLFGVNALGLKLQPHLPFATHWRLYSPWEVADLCVHMNCEVIEVTTFLRTEPFSLKSRAFLAALRWFRRASGNGDCSYGQHVHVVARKRGDPAPYRPEWLFPATDEGGRTAHLGSLP